MGFPLFKALGASISYIAVHFLTVVKILWLPSAILFAVQILTTSEMFETQSRMFGPDPGDLSIQFGSIWRVIGVNYLAMAVCYPMMYAGLLRHVIRGKAPRLPFYISFGADELRVLGAFLLLIVITLGVYIIGLLIMLVAGVTAGALHPEVGNLVAILGIAAFIGALIWFYVRMSLVYAAAIGERSLGVSESWTLTEGFFWGLFFFWLVICVLLAVLFGAFMIVFAADELKTMLEVMVAGGDFGSEVGGDYSAFMGTDAPDFSDPKTWLEYFGSYIAMIVIEAVMIAPAGIAYRYLIEAEAA